MSFSCTHVHYPDKPEKVFNEYFKAIATGDYKKSLNYISSEEKVLVEDKYKNNDVLNEFNAITYKLTTWKIEKVEIDKNEAKLTVLLDSPNIGEIFGRNIADMSIKSYEGDKLPHNIYNDIYKKVTKELKNGNFTYINSKKEIRFKHENDKWKIFLDLQKDEQVKKLILEASKLSTEGKYNEARGKLKEVFIIDKDNILAKDLLKRIEKLKK